MPWPAYVRRAGLLILAVATAAACIRLFPHVWRFFGASRHNLGWDFKVVCSSLDALAAGLDPYLSSTPFPLPYPILHVYLFAPLCAAAAEPAVYAAAYISLAVTAGIILCRIVPATAADRALVFVAIFMSFHAFQWQLITGNAAVVELPLAAVTVYLLTRRQHPAAGLVFGLMASLKILPIVGALAFLFLPESGRERMRSFAAAIGSFLAVHLINAVAFRQWLPSYLHELTGRIGNPETGGIYDQNTIYLVIDGLRYLGLDQPLVGFALAGLGLGAGYLTALACARSGPDRGGLPPAATVSLVVLVLWLFLFRQKNYALGAFIPFMIAAAYGVSRRTALAAVCVSIVVPAALRNYTLPIPVLPLYYQLAGAWAAVMVILVGAIFTLRRPSQPPGAAAERTAS